MSVVILFSCIPDCDIGEFDQYRQFNFHFVPTNIARILCMVSTLVVNLHHATTSSGVVDCINDDVVNIAK